MAKSQSRDKSLAKAVIAACGKSELRADGYQNVLTKYGTKRDSSSAFSFVPENFADDYTLSINYQFNGLFAKIIDLPAGEAVSKGFTLNIVDKDIDSVIMEKWEDLNAEESFETAIKWARLYGGSIIVPLVNDGRGLDESLNFRTIRGVDELKVFEAAIVNPIYQSTYYTGMPEYFQVNSLDGIFTVHSSRCLLFKNGKLPELAIDSKRRVFGFSEYDRIKAALREAVTTHGYAPRMLERSIQPILKIKDLAALLESESGEDIVVKRLQVIDLARSMFNSLAIDSDGEDYDFKTASFTGVKEIIDSTCNMLSAVTDIPQTLLFGRAPEGMNATGEADFENYYNMVRRIQSRIVKTPHKKLLDIIIQSLVRTGRLEETPTYKLEYNPLWSMSEQEQATVDQTKAQTQLIKAQTTQLYMDSNVLDPTEVRTALKEEGEYNVETVLEELDDNEVFGDLSNMNDTPVQSVQKQLLPKTDTFSKDSEDTDIPTAAAVIVLNKNGYVLCGLRSDNNLICGPGGHIEPGEAPIQAAIREAQEEFNITPISLVPLSTIGENTDKTHKTAVFVCNNFEGTPMCDEDEMHTAMFMPVNVLFEYFNDKLFAPFKKSLEIYQKTEQIGQLSEVENSDDCGIIIKDGAPYNNKNACGPHDMSGGPKVKGPNGKEITLSHNPKDFKNVTLGTGDETSGHIVGGFEGKGKKDAHIKKHAKEMGMNEKQYLVAANEFLSKPLSESMEEIVITGPNGYSVISRYDFSTNEFGVINPRGNISTYYKPKKGIKDWEKIIEKDGEKNE